MSVLSGGRDILSSSYILSENVPIPSIVCLSSLGESDPLILDELTLLTMIIKSSTIELLTKTLIFLLISYMTKTLMDRRIDFDFFND